MKSKIEKGIPNIYLACNPLLGDMDTDKLKLFQSKQSAWSDLSVEMLEFSGGTYDRSDILQNILQIDNDVDVMFRRCETWPIAMHKDIIEHIPGTGIYCHLNVTHFPKLQEQFPTVKRGDKVYLSAAMFRQYYLERDDIVHADIIFEIPRCLDDLGDMVGKASYVRMFHGQQPIDVIHYIPCEDSKEYPKYSFPCGDSRISSEFGLIPKSRDDGDPEIDWRLSFTHLENKIVKEIWSINDHIAYTLFKCIIKTHVAMPSYLKSYHLKLCMFLTQMQIPGVSRLSFCQRLLILLDFLLYSVTKGFLPHPFMHHRTVKNYFENIPNEKLKILGDKIYGFRKKMKELPDDLGLYKEKPTEESLKKERVYLLCLATVAEIEIDIRNYKFRELKELFLDQETYLYMFESYLYKSLDKLCLDDHTLVHMALNDSNFLRKRYEVMLCNLRLSLFDGEFFGFYDKKSTSLAHKIEERCQIWNKNCSNTLFYQICNKTSVFEMQHMPLAKGFIGNTSIQVICLCPVNNTYGSTFHLFHHTTDFNASQIEKYLDNLHPIRYVRPEKTLTFNLWATRQIYWHNRKSFNKLRCPETDFEIKVCKSIIQSIFVCATGGFYKL